MKSTTKRILLGIFLVFTSLFVSLINPHFVLDPRYVVLFIIGLLLIFGDKLYLLYKNRKRKVKELKYLASKPKPLKELMYPEIEEERESSEGEGI